jgi:beta-lactamase class A
MKHGVERIQTFDLLHTATFQQDMRTGQVLDGINSAESFPAASLGKLFIVAATLKLIEEGKFSLYDHYFITPEQFQKNKYGTGRLKLEFMPWVALSRIVHKDMLPSKTLEELLSYSIKFSDNMAISKVADIADRNRLQDIVSDWGLYDTTILNPKTHTTNATTARDMGQFLNEFGKGYLVNDEQLSIKFLKWLPARKITAQTGEDILVRYKTGNITEVSFSYCHQAGYLASAKSDHLFVVLTKDKTSSEYETTYPQQARVKDLVEESAFQLA